MTQKTDELRFLTMAIIKSTFGLAALLIIPTFFNSNEMRMALKLSTDYKAVINLIGLIIFLGAALMSAHTFLSSRERTPLSITSLRAGTALVLWCTAYLLFNLVEYVDNIA